MKRSPQLALRLDAAAPDADAQWRAGAAIDYLGARLTLVLDTACRAPERVDRQLHLPLPPAATPRQIRDAAESWLRDEALRIFDQLVAAKSALAGRCAPRIVLVFGKRGDWVRAEGDLLRCHWRLVEQPLAVIEQVLGQALAAHAAPVCDDLFALV
jgi:predicted metal-dependent hydrolase